MNTPINTSSLNQSGTPDLGFGSNGAAPLPQILKKHPEFIAIFHFKGLTTDNNGKVLFSANLHKNGLNVFGLGRLRADGSLDTSFAANGVVSQSFLPLTPSGGSRLAVQPDDAILALGWTWRDSGNGWADLVVTRYDDQGAPDPRFGIAGMCILPTPQNEGLTEDSATVHVQSDGKILVSANYSQRTNPDATHGTVFRLLTDGTLDTSLNGTGRLDFKLADSSAATAVNACISQGSSQKIVIVGNARLTSLNQRAVIARLNSDGTPDTTFGLPQTPGYHTVAVAGKDCTFHDVIERPDKSIVAAGQVGIINTDVTQGLLHAITPDGDPHLLFNAGQPLLSQFDSARDNGWQCVKATDGGDIVTASRGSWIYVARFKATGTLDTTFNNKGYTDFASPVVTDPVLLTERGDQRIIACANTLGIDPNGIGSVRSFLG